MKIELNVAEPKFAVGDRVTGYGYWEDTQTVQARDCVVVEIYWARNEDTWMYACRPDERTESSIDESIPEYHIKRRDGA